MEEAFVKMRDRFAAVEDRLRALRSSDRSLAERWMEMIGIVLPIQKEVIAEYGFTPDQEGLLKFNHQQGCEAQKEALWKDLLEVSFGVSGTVEISDERVLEMLEAVACGMEEEEFLSAVECATKDVEGLVAKRARVLELMIPMQMKVIERFGFKGDEGYILFQRTLADHAHRPEVSARSRQVQTKLFSRAGL